jgi:hypothetical protein
MFYKSVMIYICTTETGKETMATASQRRCALEAKNGHAQRDVKANAHGPHS